MVARSCFGAPPDRLAGGAAVLCLMAREGPVEGWRAGAKASVLGLWFVEIVRKSVIQGLWTQEGVRIDAARSETGWPTGLRRLSFRGFGRVGS